MKNCPSCSLDFPNTARFCERCGGNLADEESTLVLNTLSCPSCGKEVKVGSEVCSNCNYKFSWIASYPTSLSHLCPKCGTDNPLGDLYCRECGNALEGSRNPKLTEVGRLAVTQAPSNPQIQTPVQTPTPPAPTAYHGPTISCNHCGVSNRPGMRFCESCGKPLGVPAQQPIVQTRPVRKPRKLLFIAVGSSALLVALFLFWFLWGVNVTIRSNPPGARVFIDGEEIGRTSFSDSQILAGHLGRGQHTLRIERPGFTTSTQTFDLGLLEFSKTIEINLSPSVFTLTVVTDPPGSQVLIDSNYEGATDSYEGELVLPNISKGQHTLTLRREGYEDWTRELTVESSQMIRANLTPLIKEPIEPIEPEGDLKSAQEREIESTLQAWARSLSNKDLDGTMRYYAERLDTFLQYRDQSREQVRANRAKFFSRHISIDIQLSNIHINLDSTGTRATVTLDTTYNFRDPKVLTGSAQNELWLEKRGSSWLITSEKHIQTYYENAE